jgi:hypothetical protein
MSAHSAEAAASKALSSHALAISQFLECSDGKIFAMANYDGPSRKNFDPRQGKPAYGNSRLKAPDGHPHEKLKEVCFFHGPRPGCGVVKRR